ncbi:MAG TPA: DNA repair exonuclease [Dehalococcoidia bacterium]|nr:DNA repair exonuclease [Dehalococcoidia bacterium]
MATILHTADVHLDRAYAGAGMGTAIAAARREELRAAFRRLIDLALELRVDAVTIGGDLYEHERVTPDTANFIRAQLERLVDIPALVAPGNHDPFVPGSVYQRITWPPNVTIFKGPAFLPFELAAGVTVWGAAHTTPDMRQNLLTGLRLPESGCHILLFHGSDMHSVPEGKPAHAPFMPDDVGATGADFALLGHYHASRLFPPDRPAFVYPGTPEPLDFAEEGEHFVARLDIDESGAHCRLLPFGVVRYQTHSIDVTGLDSSDEIRAAISARADSSLIARTILVGHLHPEVDFSLETLYNACAESFAYLDLVDQTQPAYLIDELAEESTTKGVFVRLMRDRIHVLEGAEREIVEQALLYGLEAFDRREIRVR